MPHFYYSVFRAKLQQGILRLELPMYILESLCISRDKQNFYIFLTILDSVTFLLIVFPVQIFKTIY